MTVEEMAERIVQRVDQLRIRVGGRGSGAVRS